VSGSPDDATEPDSTTVPVGDVWYPGSTLTVTAVNPGSTTAGATIDPSEGVNVAAGVISDEPADRYQTS